MFSNLNNNNNNQSIKRAITSSHWSAIDLNENDLRNRFNSLSIYGSDAESLVGSSPLNSPFGSPVKHSADKWSESINAFNRQSDENPLNPKKWSTLETERIDSKNDFNKNGIEVPLWEGMDKKCIGLGASYELFGKNNFTYAKIGSTVTSLFDKELNSCVKSKQRRRLKTQMFCAFCKNNNETPDMFNSHILKDPDGKTVCPVLRKYDCPVCRSGGGDRAHTIRYCPQNKSGERMPSVIKILKSSRSADGKKRTN